jgi:probable HAF family extracellular repeat protein
VGINAAGQVIGASYAANNMDSHAFLYSGGVMTDLGTLGGTHSEALAINGAGQVAGWSSTVGEDVLRAFVYSGGALRDLNTLIPSGSGWVLNVATAINDQGQIAGRGLIGGDEHAFLLTPVATTMAAQVRQPITPMDPASSTRGAA